MPDHCLVHECSNRSDMNAGISAHFSPTTKSERDMWLRFLHTHRANLIRAESLWRVCSSPFRRGMFFKSVSHGRLSSSAYPWLNSYNTEDRARKTIFQTTTPQRNASINPSGAHPPPGNRGAFGHIVSPGGGVSAILSQPGGWALAYPGATSGHLTHVFSKWR